MPLEAVIDSSAKPATGSTTEVSSFQAFVKPLRNLICDSFTDSNFKELLILNLDAQHHPDIPASGTFGEKVFETLRWVYRLGGFPEVLWLAKRASEQRPKRLKWRKLVEDMEKAAEGMKSD